MKTAILFLFAAILTCIAEAPIIYLALRKNKPKKLFLCIILINLTTNLSLNIANLFFQSFAFIILAELVIPIMEAYMYRLFYPKISAANLLSITYIANAFSLGIGFLIF